MLEACFYGEIKFLHQFPFLVLPCMSYFRCLCSLLQHELSPPRMIASFQILPF